MLCKLMLVVGWTALTAAAANAQTAMPDPARADPAPAAQGSTYPSGSQPLPSQTDGVLLQRGVTVVNPATGASASASVLSNTPVPNPNAVRAAGAAPMPAIALPLQNNGVLIMTERTVVDPATGVATRVQVVSNTPIPNPEDLPRRRAR